MQRDARGWIKVEDGLPEDGDTVNVVVWERGKPKVDHAQWLGGWYEVFGEEVLYKITHWQPLPELPEELEAQP